MRSAPLLEIAGAAVRDHLSLLRSANARAVRSMYLIPTPPFAAHRDALILEVEQRRSA